MAHSFVHVHLVALRYFAETVRTGSMRQAAEVLSVAPSAVNRQILKLEEQLQVRLFDRVSDGVRMNAAGEVLYRYIRNLEQDLETAIDHIYEMRGISRGNVRIATEDGIARDFLAAELAIFAEKYPRITYSVQSLTAQEVLDALVAGDCDIALSVTPPARNDMKVEATIKLPSGVLVAPSHALAARDSITLSELTNERMILGNAGFGGAAGINYQLSEGGRNRPFIECNSSDLGVSLLRQGLGCAIRTPLGVLEHLQKGELAFVPLTGKNVPNVTMCVWTHPNARPAHAAAILLQQLSDAMPALDRRIQPWRLSVA